MGRYYYCNEDARNLVNLEIENRKKALELYPQIIECVEKFNGKVLNKRFETALRKIDDCLRYNWEDSRFGIEVRLNNRCIQSVKTDTYGYAQWNYISGFELTLTSMLYTVSYNPDDRRMLDENGRIIAPVIIKALNERKQSIENTIAELEEKLNNVQEYRNKLEALRIEMEKVMNDVPYIIREYFDINYRVENR